MGGSYRVVHSLLQLSERWLSYLVCWQDVYLTGAKFGKWGGGGGGVESGPFSLSHSSLNCHFPIIPL